MSLEDSRECNKKARMKAMRKKKHFGIDEMKMYLKMFKEQDDQAIAFMLGSLTNTFEELRKSLGDSEPSPKELQYLMLGRLTAVLDLLLAYFELHRTIGGLKAKQINAPYV